MQILFPYAIVYLLTLKNKVMKRPTGYCIIPADAELQWKGGLTMRKNNKDYNRIKKLAIKGTAALSDMDLSCK